MKKITTLLTIAAFACFTWQGFSQETCANAVTLTPGTAQAGDSTGQAGDFPNAGGAPENPCNGFYNDDEYWFEYTAVADGEKLQLDMTDISNTWAGLFVLDNCPDSTPACVGSATNTGSTADLSFETGALTAGTSYKIVIANWGTPNNTAFTLNATVIAPPACPDILNITSANNPDGSVNLDWDDAAGAAGYNYEVQPQGTAQGTAGALVMDTSATSDAVVATGVLTDGSDYTLYVQSDCGAGALGNFQSLDFTFTIPPANDTCDGAIDLDDLTSPVSGTTVGAGNNYVVDCLTNVNAPDVLYSITVPNGYLFDFVQTVNNYDSKVRIAYGGSCPGDTAIVCFDDPDTGAQQWTNDTGAEQEVYIVISAFSTGSGTFTFDYLLTPPAPTPGGDDCASAVAVTEGTYFQTQINDATAGTNNGDSAWFAYTASEDGTVNVNSCLGGADTRLFILDDCAGVAIADNDDSCAFAPDGTGSTFASEVAELDVTSGTTYYIQWDDRWSVDPFDWSITFTPAPTCPEVINVVVTPSLNDAAISWDEVTEATIGYVVSVFTTGADPMVDTPVYTENVATGTLMTTATGLMDTTTYDAYVYADCDAQGISLASPVSFSTPPPPPVCGGKFYDTGGPDGDFMNSEDYQVIISPDVVGDVVTASFVFVDNAGGGFDMLTVDIGDGNFVLVPDVDLGDPAVDFTSIAADGSLVFNFVSSAVVPNPGWDADITCGPPPTCPEPSNFAVANVTDTTADFTWDDVTEAADGYTLSVFDAGADPMVDTPVYTEDVATGVLTATATGLSQATDYDAYINANCGVGDLSTLDLLNFTTGITPPPPPVCGGKFYDTGGEIADYQNGESYSFLITADDAANVVTLDFLVVDIEAGWDFLRIYDGDDATAPELSDPTNGVQVPGQFSGTVPGGNIFVTFTSDGSVQRAGWDADVICGPLPCAAPENVVVSNESGTGADITWDLAPTAVQGYQVAAYVAGDFTTPVSNSPVLPATTTMYTVTGLDQDTAYDVYVISLCDLGADPQDISYSDPVPLNTILGSEDFNTLDVSFFPNPTTGIVTLNSKEEVQTINVYSVLGQEILKSTPNSTSFEINLSNVANGTYYVKATSNGATSVIKVIKE
ncbi:fibronectin type III domain-containing protein [Patiriisocius marinus]|uniref:fibronectin type III domain-containing protein n=1 Tax=Patiriisocius marinus TaxID=1397112 RepID=UPI002330D438|nr:fibronectin type III domain-containing protein [Patiriisocius marinus]